MSAGKIEGMLFGAALGLVTLSAAGCQPIWGSCPEAEPEETWLMSGDYAAWDTTTYGVLDEQLALGGDVDAVLDLEGGELALEWRDERGSEMRAVFSVGPISAFDSSF